MNSIKLDEILKDHRVYLDTGEGKRANLSGANLNGANLRWANLRWANLNGANLRWANLRWANLRGANLSGANLSGADLSRANLNEANLNRANLRWANLRGANLSGANLSGADLSRANLTDTIGLLSPSEYLRENFEWVEGGLIVYKSFGENHPSSPHWNISPGSIIEEVVNFGRAIDCACGVNVGTLKWCEDNCRNQVWKCLIRYEWLAGVCVPYHTDGKIRAEKVEILEMLDE